MRILLTDGDNRAALAIVRSLGSQGHVMVVGERHGPALAQTSRYCSERFVYPDPFKDEHGFLMCVLDEVRRHQIDVLIPVADVTTALIVERRSEFERLCKLPLASADVIAKAADKVGVLELAARLDVPTPATAFINSPEEALGKGATIGYPLVLKARRSRVRTAAGWESCSVAYASSPEALMSRVRTAHPQSFPLILQERIDGPGIGMFLCYDNGAPIAVFSHRRLREKPPSGGVSVLCESLASSPVVLRHSQSLLDALGWHGVAMVEFKLDPRDDTPKLMEINGRFWGSLQLAIDAGVDFPAILLSTVTGHAPVLQPTYRVGVKSRWWWGDVDSLLLRTFGRHDTVVNGTSSGLAAELWAFLKLWEKDLYYENPRLSDLKPWLHETSQWMRHLGAHR